MALALGRGDLHEQGNSVALVPQEGRPGGDALADIDIYALAHAPGAHVQMVGISFNWGSSSPRCDRLSARTIMCGR